MPTRRRKRRMRPKPLPLSSQCNPKDNQPGWTFYVQRLRGKLDDERKGRGGVIGEDSLLERVTAAAEDANFPTIHSWPIGAPGSKSSRGRRPKASSSKPCPRKGWGSSMRRRPAAEAPPITSRSKRRSLSFRQPKSDKPLRQCVEKPDHLPRLHLSARLRHRLSTMKRPSPYRLDLSEKAFHGKVIPGLTFIVEPHGRGTCCIEWTVFCSYVPIAYVNVFRGFAERCSHLTLDVAVRLQPDCLPNECQKPLPSQ